MTWFKVDDKFHSHIKTARAGVDALGLWVMCGSWCADHLTDGFVPDYIALRMDSKARSKASKLVSAGLWSMADRDGDKGWQFHDWCDMQPTKDDVETRREQEREKKRRYREKASRGENGQFVSDVPDVSTGESTVDKEVRPPGSPDGCPPVPVPSRPDPTRPDRSSSSELRPDVESLLDHLDGCIKANGAKVPGRTRANIDAARLLIERDGRDVDEILAVIDWATSDEFWRTNILSMSKLRAQYDQLNLKRTTQPRPRFTRQQETDDLFAAAARRMGVTPQPLHNHLTIEGTIA